MKRRFRIFSPLLVLLTVMLIAGVIAVVLQPVIEYRQAMVAERSTGEVSVFTERGLELTLLESIQERAMIALVLSWIFFLGGAIGSFLNVVVWRMPRGVSVAAGGSKCPFCRTPIHSLDNIPIFGWVKLRGRCRACRLPISPRYPTVELLLAVAFLTLGIFELLLSGVNLPGPIRSEISGLGALIGDWGRHAIFAHHACLLTLLLGAGLIIYDGQRIPKKLWAFMLIWGFGMPLVTSEVASYLWVPYECTRNDIPLLAIVGAGAGGLLALAAKLRLESNRNIPAPIGFSLVAVGLFLGPAAAAIVLLATGIVTLGIAALSRTEPIFQRSWVGLAVCEMTLLFLIVWNMLSQLPVDITDVGSRNGILVVMAVGVIVMIVARHVQTEERSTEWLPRPDRHLVNELEIEDEGSVIL